MSTARSFQGGLSVPKTLETEKPKPVEKDLFADSEFDSMMMMIIMLVILLPAIQSVQANQAALAQSLSFTGEIIPIDLQPAMAPVTIDFSANPLIAMDVVNNGPSPIYLRINLNVPPWDTVDPTSGKSYNFAGAQTRINSVTYLAPYAGVDARITGKY